MVTLPEMTERDVAERNPRQAVTCREGPAGIGPAGSADGPGARGDGRATAVLTERAAKAGVVLRRSSGGRRSEALRAASRSIEAAASVILEANREDVSEAEASGAAGALVDRLKLGPARITSMSGSLSALAGMPDPVGSVVDGWQLPNGVSVRRVRVPLGLVGVVYEARPNVTAEAAGIALRSANSVVLRGSSNARRSNEAVAAAIRSGIESAGLPADCVVLVEDTSREAAVDLLRSPAFDCLIPRGGPSLLATVRENAVAPVIIDGEGNCHVYVDAAADLEQAAAVVANAKCSRPSVCNAAETLLVHEAVAPVFLPMIASLMGQVELRGDERVRAILPGARAAGEQDWATEFLDLVLAVRVVDDMDTAMAHIARYGSGHSEAICTTDFVAARRFCREVDAAAVLVNASTRLVDGGQLGFGGEIGISTQKLHVRGPMGPEALTCVKLVLEGDGQVRN
ncbi:MAG: glutamate-5-semialdehyde dehydrogenase [Actinomycetota bacterium]|nr:glutamate-5-semialdehyde dehydrogenase [Actinomycetota bacterium]